MPLSRRDLNVVVTLLLTVGFPFLSAQAEERSPASRVLELNNRILSLYRQIQQGNASATNTRTESLMRERSVAMRELIQRHASEARPLMFSREVVADLARRLPKAAQSLESHGAWRGAVERFIADDGIGGCRSVYTIKLEEETLQVHFSGYEPSGLASGDSLWVSGFRSGEAILATEAVITAKSSTKGSLRALAASASSCSSTGAQNAAVLLVTFPNVAPPLTSLEVRDIFFASLGPSLDGFWREASYGKTWVSGNVYGWYTLNGSYTCADMDRLRADAISAAALDVDFAIVNRLFIVLPDMGCGWAGFASSPCAPLNSPDGQFIATTTYLRADLMTPRSKGVQLVTHEAGHNLSLLHAGTRDFGSDALGSLGVRGNVAEFGDWFSTLGTWSLGQYSAPHRQQLGWIREGIEFQTVETSGAYTLAPLETGPGGLKALKIRRGSGNDAWLWLEYRQPVGDYDSTIPATIFNEQVFTGALIHYQDAQTTAFTTHLLDFTPETDSWMDPALSAGQIWNDSHSGLSISIVSSTPEALMVNVISGAAPCGRAAPTVLIFPSMLSLAAGQRAEYSVSVTNSDSSACSSTTFHLTSTEPTAWPSGFSQSTLILNPGATGHVVLTKTAPSGIPVGAYTVDAVASTGSLTGTGMATCNVVVPAILSATVTLPKLVYETRAEVSMSAAVLSDGKPAAGASVEFRISKPNGTSASQKMTADGAGIASWSYRLQQNDKPGTYSVAASATLGAASTISPATVFTVARSAGAGKK